LLTKQTEELKFEVKISSEKALSEIVTLNDQKKILVKEVKQCRKKIDSLTADLSAAIAEKESSSSKHEALIQSFSQLQAKLAEQEQQHAVSILSLREAHEGRLSRDVK